MSDRFGDREPPVAGTRWRRDSLNFSWVLPGALAGCRVPVTEEEVIFLHQSGVRSLVRVIESHVSGIASSVLWRHGMTDFLEPVRDFTAPTSDQIVSSLYRIASELRAGRPTAVACAAGRGRTGTILACALVLGGRGATNAIAEVRRVRPYSVESGEQEEAVHEFEALVQRSTGLVAKLDLEWPKGASTAEQTEEGPPH